MGSPFLEVFLDARVKVKVKSVQTGRHRLYQCRAAAPQPTEQRLDVTHPVTCSGLVEMPFHRLIYMSALLTGMLALRSTHPSVDRRAHLPVRPPGHAGEVLHLSHIQAQVAGIIVVTCSEKVWQHCLEEVLLEEEVTVLLSGQEHERQQCRLDKAVHP